MESFSWSFLLLSSVSTKSRISYGASDLYFLFYLGMVSTSSAKYSWLKAWNSLHCDFIFFEMIFCFCSFNYSLSNRPYDLIIDLFIPSWKGPLCFYLSNILYAFDVKLIFKVFVRNISLRVAKYCISTLSKFDKTFSFFVWSDS